ncbi:MAG: TAT-variant-translocated molybdopterin oxidoreductase [Candidatus Zixiibacteriota bacterium]|nr:MAG: TAT-variant-translocated molybdopterin oxidoreductase [candidate division Zixibacteria bacterium]
MNKDRKKDKVQWRSLDELADTPEFKEFLHREFPQGASEMNNDWSRRNFLTLMGASLALAGLAGCRRPEQKIVPYVKPPEEVIPGIPQYYATTMPFGNSAYGLVVESYEGRPSKIEGNPKHPSTLGASNAWIQASILGLYDPDRSKRVMHNGQESSWDKFVTIWREHSARYDSNGGDGLAVLSEPFSSPTLARLRKEFLRKYPNAQWVTYEPAGDENIFDGVSIVIPRGSYLPLNDFGRADVIVSFDCDFLLTESDSIAASRGFVQGRRLTTEYDSMNRLYVFEPGFSPTGAVADHRVAVEASIVPHLVVALANALKAQGLVELELPRGYELPEALRGWVEKLAEELTSARGRSLVVAGRSQPGSVHALVLAINDALGNLGRTLTLVAAPDGTYSRPAELRYRLIKDIRDGRVKTLVLIGGNPCYSVPANLEFRKVLEKVETSIHLSPYYDETSRRSIWHIPQAHYLESWGDASAPDGTRSVIQPLIAPLSNGIASVEFANLIATGANSAGYDIVRDTWENMLGSAGFENKWRRVLHDGVSTQPPPQTNDPVTDYNMVIKALDDISGEPPGRNNGLELVFALSPSLYDGRFANNGWLQELPHPMTKLAWDNAALVSPRTAEEHGVKNGDMVKLSYRERELEMPIWILPGMADNTVLLELGYGQENLGRVANGVGFNTYLLRHSDAPYYDRGLTMVKTGKTYKLASTQNHGSMEGRPHVREATLDEYRRHPNFAPEAVHHPPLVSMWKDHKYDEGYQWGMAIDLTACTGCNACTVACQSENNIPIVGKEQVLNGREMHWIRVDRYFTGDKDRPSVVYQPVACQHCEMAPCEQVCPVAATMHDNEGLNTMVYNRCIGTRYCANNCPYKVRRFNFFNFTKDTPEVTKMVNNPDVTVRSRGVMEKCTYCVQRINRVKIEAKKEDREVTDGEITTACQQACPTGAIVFGNVNDPESKVSKVKARNRNYDLLGELNVRPRTSYLAKIRNPNAKVSESD